MGFEVCVAVVVDSDVIPVEIVTEAPLIVPEVGLAPDPAAVGVRAVKLSVTVTL